MGFPKRAVRYESVSRLLDGQGNRLPPILKKLVSDTGDSRMFHGWRFRIQIHLRRTTPPR